MDIHDTVIFGTKVRLIGTRHSDTEEVSDIVDAIRAVSPNVLLIELEEWQDLQRKAESNNDIAAFNQYLANTDVEYVKYDSGSSKGYYTHLQTAPDSFDLDEYMGKSSRGERRTYLRRNHREMFRDYIARREEEAADTLFRTVADSAYDSVVMHCGKNHFSPLVESLSVLK